MGVIVNHAIGFLISPLVVSLTLVAVGCGLAFFKMRRCGVGVAMVGLFWLYLMSSSGTYRVLGMGLEGDYPPAPVESLPSADAIVILGGGMGANTNALCYPELYMSADRVAHAARIWKAGKAPIVISSGQGDLWTTVPFLKELGVPESAILAENDSRNGYWGYKLLR